MNARLVLPLFVGSVLACAPEGDLEVHFALHGSDLGDLEIVAVPFDPDALLDSLAATAADPQPTFAELERALLAYVPSDDEALWAITEPWLALRDSVAALSSSLHAMDRSMPAYADEYERFRTLYATFTRRTAERDRKLRELDGNSVMLARWAQAAADTLRAWERTAYDAYDSIAATAVARTDRQPRSATTDFAGDVHVVLPTGQTWWIIARRADPTNPFLEYYWSVPVRVNVLVPTVLDISENHAKHRWRH